MIWATGVLGGSGFQLPVKARDSHVNGFVRVLNLPFSPRQKALSRLCMKGDTQSPRFQMIHDLFQTGPVVAVRTKHHVQTPAAQQLSEISSDT